MKQKLLSAVSLLLIAAPAITQAADDMPKQAAFARYEAMMNHSLFAVATAVVAPPVAPNFAKDLYIANAARLEDEGVVTLTSSVDKNMKEYLSTKAPNLHGYSISNIEWSDRVGQTKVTIEKDGQSAVLTFNQALMTQPVAGMQPPPPPQIQPAQVPVQSAAQVAPYANANQIKPAPIPTLPTPPPRVRGVIQRNPVPTKGQSAKEQSIAPSATQGAVDEATDQ
jgi:hypothetical protein